MMDLAKPLSNPLLAIALRAVLGGYVIYMSRKFYEDPTGYFRKSARQIAEVPSLKPIVRGLACFCLWGGCFIVSTDIAVQIFGLHGDLLALELVTLSAIATWFLLPKHPDSGAPEDSEIESMRKPK